jgi:hypothetical protein
MADLYFVKDEEGSIIYGPMEKPEALEKAISWQKRLAAGSSRSELPVAVIVPLDFRLSTITLPTNR